jgi:hypothetical protein
MYAAFIAVVPAMNACMQVPLKAITGMPLSEKTFEKVVPQTPFQTCSEPAKPHAHHIM